MKKVDCEGVGDNNGFFEMTAKVGGSELDDLLSVLADISNMCIGEIAMNYKLDPQLIGEMIHKATGMTNPELNKYVEQRSNEKNEG